MRRDGLGRRVLAAMRALVSLVLVNMFVVAATATPLSPVARSEIDSLMSRLEAAGCEFSRNGKWYAGAEAKSHLLRKLQYLEERGAVQSAEQFIELAASSSSTSGQPYLVKCNNGTPVPSGVWLRTQLQTLRKSAPAKGAP